LKADHVFQSATYMHQKLEVERSNFREEQIKQRMQPRRFFGIPYSLSRKQAIEFVKKDKKAGIAYHDHTMEQRAICVRLMNMAVAVMLADPEALMSVSAYDFVAVAEYFLDKTVIGQRRAADAKKQELKEVA
jgi:hypothetical protein